MKTGSGQWPGAIGQRDFRAAVFEAPSIPSLAGAVVYVLVAGLAARAATVAHRQGRTTGEIRQWRAICAMFAIFAAIRVLNIDHDVQDIVRAAARSDRIYNARSEWQRPVSAALVLVLGVLAYWTVRTISRQRRKPVQRVLVLARFAAIAMATYFAIRLVSLHAIDALIYRGGIFRVNYLIDMGLAGLIGLCSAIYVRQIRRERPR
ncbi:hypothetical protein RXV95_03135 [Novosphingobium sp. ZN18A2]|uniref:hypothetical protein n=1 Tax=Novosphingobium sp. ZN18A2 TaxID=3079861 RepID=UPI0030D265FE